MGSACSVEAEWGGENARTQSTACPLLCSNTKIKHLHVVRWKQNDLSPYQAVSIPAAAWPLAAAELLFGFLLSFCIPTCRGARAQQQSTLSTTAVTWLHGPENVKECEKRESHRAGPETANFWLMCNKYMADPLAGALLQAAGSWRWHPWAQPQKHLFLFCLSQQCPAEAVRLF